MIDFKRVAINFVKRARIPILILLVNIALFGQSTHQNTPTPVTSNEINGSIKARAIGDSRLTNYFYAFNGNQGDVFINIVTSNLDGDVDVFTLEGVRPLTKITLFSDNPQNETGRIVYLRKFERLLLRIQGRSPNDDPATFRIKFAGSFQPLIDSGNLSEVKPPEVSPLNKGEVRVNSVGTIIEPIPKTETPVAAEILTNPLPEAAEPVKTREINVTSVDTVDLKDASAKIEIRIERDADVGKIEEVGPLPSLKETPGIPKPVVVVTDETPQIKAKEVAGKQPSEKIEPDSAKETDESKAKTPNTEVTPKTVLPLNPEQLQKIELVVDFKDGKTIRTPMNKVFSFNVNQGILTIIMNDGKVSRHSLLDVVKISIQ